MIHTQPIQPNQHKTTHKTISFKDKVMNLRQSKRAQNVSYIHFQAKKQETENMRCT